MRRLARAVAASSLLLLVACGTNAPEVPKELLGRNSSCAATSYPSEGFGTEPGDVVQNACFTGYRAPDRIAPAEENRETIAFSDYYDPAGTKGVSLILINTAAIWCSACVAEHQALPDHVREHGSEGLVIVSTLFQDAHRNPASISDVERWIANFHTDFPMVADPDLLLGAYASPDSAPLNMLVDPRSMKILRKYVGDQSSEMWTYVDAQLGARSAQD